MMDSETKGYMFSIARWKSETSFRTSLERLVQATGRQNGQRTRVKNYKMFWNNANSLTTIPTKHIVMTFVATDPT